ncbi:MAG: protein kinase [Isosphaeraceae bacterium]
MSQTGFRRPDDSTCDLLGGWQFGEVPPLDDDSDPFSTASPPIGPKTGPATPPAPPPQNQPRNREERQSEPPRPRSTPPPDSDPFRDFRLDPGSEGLSLSIQSLLRPNLRPQAPPSHDPSHTAPPPTPPTAPIAPVRVSATVPGPRTSTTPRVGDILGGYRLVGELGRGAFARVFLAEQANLANRRVALKVSQAEGDEPLLLARLQHTHIVPIHSVEDDPLTGLRLLCMPYLGGANLAQVLEAAGGRTAPAAHRRSLVDALDEVSLRMHARPGRNVSASGYSGNPRPPLASRSAPALSAGSARSLPRRPELAESGIGSARPSGSNPYGSSARGSIARLQALWARLRWRTASTPEAPSLDERDFDQPARQFLRQANSVQAAVWIIARLAEGLEHAHSRGLLHRDLKPSNILIAADGTPMLLDFNLSTLSGPCDPDEGEKAMLGGTLPYMAPEHLDAFHPEIKGPVEAVNERSDIYALGLILFEMIAGEHPFPEPPPGTPLLEVIRKLSGKNGPFPRCGEPIRMFPGASTRSPASASTPIRLGGASRGELLRGSRPLPRRSASQVHDRAEPAERVAKWARRHPRVCHVVPVASAAAVMMASSWGSSRFWSTTRWRSTLPARLRHFESQFAESQFLLNLGTGPTGHIERGYDLARPDDQCVGPESVRERLGLPHGPIDSSRGSDSPSGRKPPN